MTHDDRERSTPAPEEPRLLAEGATTIRIALHPGRSAHDVVRSLQLSTRLLDAHADPTGTVIEVVLVLDPPRLEEQLQALRAQAAVDEVRASPPIRLAPRGDGPPDFARCRWPGH